MIEIKFREEFEDGKLKESSFILYHYGDSKKAYLRDTMTLKKEDMKDIKNYIEKELKCL